MKIEICVQSVTEIKKAIQYDIDQIELNSCLHVGGLTPSMGLFKQAKELTSLPILCMVRVRPGGFVYDEDEFSTLLVDGELLLQQGADGLVFGCLNKDLTINMEQTRQLSDLCHRYNKVAVFHRAFDSTKDPINAYHQLVDCRIDRLLTSGQQVLASDGVELIKKLVEMSQIEIVVGSGVNANNVKSIIQSTGCQWVHTSAREYVVDHQPLSTVNYQYLENNTLDILSDEKVAEFVKKVREIDD